MTDFNFELQERGSDKKPFMVVYGAHGLGKTTLCSQAPNAIFLPTEDGAGELKLRTLKDGVFESYEEFIAALRYLYANPDIYDTLVIDSLDHLDPLVLDYTLRENGWNHINEGAYGKGYQEYENHWRAILKAIKKIIKDKNKIFIGIAHSTVRTINDPTTEPYDAYEMKINKRVLPLLKEEADVIAFLTTPIVVNKNTGKAQGGTDVVACVRPTAAFEAKTRYSDMPSRIPLTKDSSWTSLSEHIPTV